MTQDLSNVLTLREAARLYPLAYSTLAQAAREGRLPARKSNGTWLTTKQAIEEAIQAGRLQPEGE